MKYLENVDIENVAGILTYRELGNTIIKGRLEAFSCDHHGNSSSNDSFCSANPLIGAATKKFSASALLNLTSNTKLFPTSSSSLDLGALSSSSSSVVTKAPASQLRKRSVSLNEWEKPVDNSRRKRSVSMSDASIPSKRMHQDLLAALGEIFPDYDYRFTSSHQFVQCGLADAVREINSYLAELTSEDGHLPGDSTGGSTIDSLWTALDNLLNLNAPTCEVYKYLRDKDDNGPLNSRKSLWSFHYFFFNKEGHKMCYFGCRGISKLQKLLHRRKADRGRLRRGGDGSDDEEDSVNDNDGAGRGDSGSSDEDDEDDDDDDDRHLTFVPTVSNYATDGGEVALGAASSEIDQLQSSASNNSATSTTNVGGKRELATPSGSSSKRQRGGKAAQGQGQGQGGGGTPAAVPLRRSRSNNSISSTPGSTGRRRRSGLASPTGGEEEDEGSDGDYSGNEDEDEEDDEDDEDGGYFRGDGDASSDSENDDLNQSTS